MKNLKFLMLALVAIVGLSSCEKQDWIDVDYSKDIVGTWTLLEPDHAAAYIFNADGTVSTTGVDGEEYWEDVKGTYRVVNNKISIKFESGRNLNGSFDIIPGQTLSIVAEKGRHTYQYCKEDLSEEVVGLWVCTDGPIDADNDLMIRNFMKDGKTTFTGLLPIGNNPESVMNYEVNYNVIGDLVFLELPENSTPKYSVERLIYAPNSTELGDIMTIYRYLPIGNDLKESYASFLRIKQNLELPGMKYDYMKTFVTNVKGEDKDIPFLNTSFNFAKMDGTIIDKFLKSTLFVVEFPDAKTIKYSFLVGGQNNHMTAPIEVDGNKITIKMSTNGQAYHDIEVYTFQDKDNTQMHMYMPTSSFEKFFANTSVHVMLGNGQLDINDTEAIAGVYKTIADAVETINVSIVMTRAPKSL